MRNVLFLLSTIATFATLQLSFGGGVHAIWLPPGHRPVRHIDHDDPHSLLNRLRHNQQQQVQRKPSSSFTSNLCSSSSSSSLHEATLGVNVKCFGAQGDAVTNDAPAINKALNYALSHRRALLFPAGVYMVNETITVPLGISSLRLRGEGRMLSSIKAARDIEAVLNISWGGVMHEGTQIEIEDLAFDGSGMANYSVLAKGLTRSSFTRVFFAAARKTGCKHGGWIDVFDTCAFNGNTVSGLELSDDNNNIVVRSCSFEGNPGTGIVLHGGTQITLQNNVIEGNQGPGVVASLVRGLTLHGNYFEYNNIRGPLTFPNGAPTNAQFYADIVLNAVPYEDLFLQIGGPYPNTAVIATGNTFAPHAQSLVQGVQQAAIAVAGVNGGVFESNQVYGFDNTTLLLTAACSTWFAKDITVRGNHVPDRRNVVMALSLAFDALEYQSTRWETWNIDSFDQGALGRVGFYRVPNPPSIVSSAWASTGYPSQLTDPNPNVHGGVSIFPIQSSNTGAAAPTGMVRFRITAKNCTLIPNTTTSIDSGLWGYVLYPHGAAPTNNSNSSSPPLFSDEYDDDDDDSLLVNTDGVLVY